VSVHIYFQSNASTTFVEESMLVSQKLLGDLSYSLRSDTYFRSYGVILFEELDGMSKQAFYLVGSVDEASAKTITLEE
jgi:F0F1-type ATP synthase beta subunit